MPVVEHALSGIVADLLGDAVDPSHTIMWVETNTEKQVVVDTNTGGKILAGSRRIDINADGSFSIDLPTTAGATNPTGFQYRVWIDFRTVFGGKTDRARWTSGYFSHTAAQDLKDVVAEQYVPPTYASQLTAQLDAHEAELEDDLNALSAGFTTELTGYRDETETFRDEAEAARDAAVDISGISTSDAVVEALVKNTGGSGPLTSAALNTAIEDTATDPTGAVAYTYGRPESVRAHGATGGSATADTAGIKAARDAAGAGGKLHFPDGTYLVNETIGHTFNDQEWYGSGKGLGKCRIRAASALSSVVRVDAYYPIMRDISIDGANLATIGILLRRAVNGDFRLVRVHDAVSHGWKCDINDTTAGGNNDLSKFWHCYAEYNGGDGFSTPAYQDDNNAMEFFSCEFSSNTGNGLRIAGAQNKVYGGEMTGNGGHGIMLGNTGDAAGTTRDNVLYAPYVEANTAGGIGAAAAGVVGTNMLIGEVTQGIDYAVSHGILHLGWDNGSASGRVRILNGLGAGFTYDGLNLIATGPSAHYNVNLYAKGVGKVISHGTGFADAFTTTSAPSAGGAGALPATPLGYVEVEINGVNRKLPYYA